MKFYTTKHRHVCGVDLHTRSLYLCVVDHLSEQPLLHKNIRAEPAAFLQALAPAPNWLQWANPSRCGVPCGIDHD